MPKLTIIIGSTRPGRAGLPIARWFSELAHARGGFEITVIDLAQLDLPLLDEPDPPVLRRYANRHTQDWSAIVEASDAFVFVTPEYNGGYPAAVKNALDYLHHEWQYKPVGFVSYGGVSAGMRAVHQLKSVATALKMLPVYENVNIPFFPQFLVDGQFRASAIADRAAEEMLDELARTEGVLRPLRPAVRPSASSFRR